MRIKIRTADNSDLERILEIFARSGLDRGESLSIERAEDILKKGMFQIHPGCPTGYRVCMSLSWETPGDSLRSITGVSETCLKKFETYPNYKVYVAEQDGEVMGVFELLIMDNLGYRGRKSAIIEDVAVNPGYQGRGIGKAMMLFAMDVARKEQCYKIVISSNIERTKAHEFYEKLGFRIHGYSFFVDI